MNFLCPNCGESITADEPIASSLLTCPHCQRQCPVPRRKIRLRISPLGTSPDLAEVGKQQLCPQCKVPMAADAVFCVKCGFDLRTGKIVQTVGDGKRPSQTRRIISIVCLLIALAALWRVYTNRQRSEFSSQNLPPVISVQSAYPAELHNQPSPTAAIVPANNEQSVRSEPETVRQATTLASAVDLGQIETVQALLNGGADANAVNEHGESMLCVAVWSENLELAKQLIDHGADVNQSTGQMNNTPLMLAAAKGNLPILDLLLQHKANPTARNQVGEDALGFAVDRDHPIVVEKFLGMGCDVHTRDVNGVGLLHLAAAANDPHLIELLLAKGVRIQEQTFAGATPLAFAVGHRSGAAVVTLLNHGADPHDAQAIAEARKPRRDPMLLEMLQTDVLQEKIRAWDKMAREVLQRNQHAEIVGLLDDGASATELLQAAIEANAVDAVPIALSQGADPLATGDDGRTLLAHAEKTGNTKVVGLLEQSLAAHNTGSPVPAITAPVKVALTTFTSDDNSYTSGLAVETLTALLQAKLSNEMGAEWVERSQLQAAEHELKLGMVSLASPAAALRVGKWLQADLLIMGRVVTTSRQQRVLRVEVVDANRADVLAETAIKLQSRLGRPLATADVDAESVSQKIRMLLQQARQQLTAAAKKSVIAPLFFANTSKVRRLDFFENDLFDAIESVATNNPVRVLRFPRAAETRGEGELALLGLSEGDPKAWQQMADVYVWGRYDEQSVAGSNFQETPVTFTLTIWNGVGEPQTSKEIVKVKELAQLRDRVVKKIVMATRDRRPADSANSVRLELARQLSLRGGEVQAQRSDWRSVQDQRLWQYEVKLLTTARFFAPELYDLHRQWLKCRWEYMHRIVERRDLVANPRLFGLRLNQLCDYAEFADAHGLLIPGTDAQKLAVDSWKQMAAEVFDAWRESLGLLKDPAGYGLTEKEAFGLPFDLPSDFRRAWIEEQVEKFIRQTINLCERLPVKSIPLNLAPGAGDLEYVFAPRDNNVRIKFIELVWPGILESAWREAKYDEHGVIYPADKQMFDIFGVFKQLTKAYRAVGNPHKAEAMIAQLSHKDTGAKALPPTAKPQKFVLVDLQPPQLNPNGRYIPFPAQPPAEGVLALQPVAGAMWVSTRSGPIVGLALRDDVPFPDGEPGLWRVPLVSEVAESISSKIGKHSTVTSLLARDAQLWMTLAQDGVWSLGTDNLKVTKYDGRNGVLSPLMMASASQGGRLYFGSSDSKLNLLEVPDQVWKQLAPPTGGPIRALSAIDQAVLCDHSIDNLDGRGWQDISGKIIQAEIKAKPMVTLPIRFVIVSKNPDGEITTRSCFVGSGGTPEEKLKILCAVPDAAAGFWIGSTHGLCRWNLTTGPTRVWLRGFEGYYVDAETGKPLTARPTTQLSGAVTALANDGDFLWVATTSRLANLEGYQQGPVSRTMYKLNECHYVFLLHKPSEKWVGCFPVSNCVASLSVTADKLWVGLESFRYLSPDRTEEKSVPSPLLVVLKQALLNIPVSAYLPDSVSEAELRAKTEAACAAVR